MTALIGSELDEDKLIAVLIAASSGDKQGLTLRKCARGISTSGKMVGGDRDRSQSLPYSAVILVKEVLRPPRASSCSFSISDSRMKSLNVISGTHPVILVHEWDRFRFRRGNNSRGLTGGDNFVGV